MSRPVPLSMSPADWGMLLVLSVLWGGSFFFVGVAVTALPPLTVVLLRVGLAAAALWLWILLRGQPVRPSWAACGGLLLMGLANNVLPFGLIAWGQTHIGGGLASILNAMTPLFTVIVAHFATADDRLAPRKVAAVLLGLAGVAVMIGPHVLDGLGDQGVGQAVVLVAALCYAFAGVFWRRFGVGFGLSSAQTAAGQVTASTLWLLPVVALVDRPWTLATPEPRVWAAVVGLAVASTALAYILYFTILRRAGASNLLLVTFLIPVTAILLGVLILGETLEPRQILGMALIGLGLAAMDGRPLRWLTGRVAARGRA